MGGPEGKVGGRGEEYSLDDVMYDNRIGRGQERLETSRQLGELHPWDFKYLEGKRKGRKEERKRCLRVQGWFNHTQDSLPAKPSSVLHNI